MNLILSGRLLLGFLLAVLASGGMAQSASVDPTFSALPTTAPPADFNFRQIIQPDGKILVYGAPTMFVNGVQRSGMFRLNPDGTTDTTFAYNNDGGVGINNVLVAPDGKIILAGTAAPNHAKMVRLNPDGSLDNSFSVFISATGPPDFTGNNLTVNAVQSDGKVIATHTSWGNIQGTYYSYSMRRYNVDGTVDATFSSPQIPGGHLVSSFAVIAKLPDGRFYLAISSNSFLGGGLSISRRLANGAIDPTYATCDSSTPGGAYLTIGFLAVTADGGLLASGALVQTGNGFPGQQQLRRYLSDGSAAPGFQSPAVYSGGGARELSDGKILYAASGWDATRPLMRLAANGAKDTTYSLDASITSLVNSWEADALGRPIFIAQTPSGRRFVRLNLDGSIDPSFNPNFSTPGSISTLTIQPDGRVLVAGAFSGMNGSARGRIARLNTNGSLDTTFDPGSGFNLEPSQLLVQPDGKILAVGSFITYNGAPVGYVARLNSDGSIDTGFNATASSGVEVVAVQSDGKILIGGTFSTVNGAGRVGIARLNTNGTLDASFNPTLSITAVRAIIAEPDGKITIGGSFTDGAGRSNFARLDSSGAVDPSFSVSVPEVFGVWKQIDGKYVVNSAGASTVLTRRHADGSADLGFASPVFSFGSSPGTIRIVASMPDGTLIVGGRFTTVGSDMRSHITRLAPNGSHDRTFLSTGANFEVAATVSAGPGKVIAVGAFTSVENVSRIGIARLNIATFQRRTPFDFDGDGRADISVFRSSISRWYEALSSGPTVEEAFGILNDIPVPADYDGDGMTDEAIFRPSEGQTWYKSSINGAQIAIPYGQSGDIPRPSDFDGDGKADIVLFRPSNSTWYRWGSQVGLVQEKAFGLSGDQPLVGDFDGDGKSDLAIFRPSNGDWWYSASSAGGAFRTVHWGQNGDVPVPADFDGDGRTDYAIFRPSDGGWYVYNSSNGSFTIMQFGTNGDRPVAADYDGDGRSDISVFRPSTGIWYLNRSTSGFAGYQFGISSDTAIPASLIP